MTDRSRGADPRWVLERHWYTGGPGTTHTGTHHARPLPRLWALPDGTAARSIVRPRPTPDDTVAPLDFTGRIRRLCADVAARCPDLAHIDPPAVLFTFTTSRTRRSAGLLARVTPMRFREGAQTRRTRGVVYRAQQYYVDGREMLYLVTFCLPRFLDLSFEEKFITVFHELYHISPQFDGDLRRHGGRYEVHSKSKKDYDAHMAVLVERYLADHPNPGAFDYLRLGASDLWRLHGGITGVTVPRPKMIPLGTCVGV